MKQHKISGEFQDRPLLREGREIEVERHAGQFYTPLQGVG